MGIVEELSDSGSIVVGSKQVMKLACADKFGKVYIGRDADKLLTGKLIQTCEKHGIDYDMSHTMQQIGSACNIEVKSACAATIKEPKKDTPGRLGC